MAKPLDSEFAALLDNFTRLSLKWGNLTIEQVYQHLEEGEALRQACLELAKHWDDAADKYHSESWSDTYTACATDLRELAKGSP